MKRLPVTFALVASALGMVYLSADEGLARKDALPVETFNDVSDAYLEGYIQALIDMHYYEFQVFVEVEDHKVYLSNLPDNALTSSSIISFVQDVPGIKSVEVRKETAEEKRSARQAFNNREQIGGVWFPQSTVLFPPLIADPRQPVYSLNGRFGDKVVGKKAVAVSLGDEFALYRWHDVFRWNGDLQIGLEAAVWAVFDFTSTPPHSHGDTCELVNTDYYVGIPLTYAFDRWSFRFRLYHISGHLGDEFLVDHRSYIHKRKNPSIEAVDLFTSYQFSKGIRLYFGPGVVWHSDHSFHIQPLYVEYGAEFRFCGRKFYYHKLYGTFFFAAHFENWQQRHWDFDETALLGYEWSKLQGVGRKVRMYVGAHNGFSYEGQFFNERTRYVDVGLSWGF